MRKIFLICILPVVTLVISCKKDTTGISNTIPNLPDTTSHKFEWTADTISADDSWQISLYDIWGADENNVWAVGHSDDVDYQIWHWNGEKWNNINPNILGYRPSYYEIFGFAENDFWIVGDGARVVGDSIDTKGYILRYDGAWHRWDNNDLPEVTSVWGTSSNNIYFGCYKGLIVKYNGADFIRYETGIDVQLKNIWGLNDTLIYANGVLSEGPLIEYLFKLDHDQFVVIDSFDHTQSGYKKYGMDLWGYDVDNFFAATANGLTKYINGEWIFQFYSTTIYSVFGSAPNNVFAGGYMTGLYHYNGDIWKQINNIDEQDGFWGIWCNNDYIFALKDFNNYRIILKGKMIQ